MIDSHCHLADKQFTADLQAVVDRAMAANVKQMVCIADTIREAHECKKIAEQYLNIYWTAGVHPHAAKEFALPGGIALLKTLVDHPKCKAIGEIGLDYHYMHSQKDVQQRVFEAQLVLAKEIDLPAVVHCREAVDDVWAIVNHVKPKKIVIHCCTEKWEDVKRFVDAGYFLSFTGIATYPKSDGIRECIRQCPVDQLMIETDSPYLAPVPHRGKRNEPAFVAQVLKLVAELKEITIEEADRITTKNTVQFFGLTVQ